VRLDGAYHQWRKDPPRELSIDLVAYSRCRRLAKDFEATIASAVAWVLVAHIRILTRRIARA
jgi:hypothetical protein